MNVRVLVSEPLPDPAVVQLVIGAGVVTYPPLSWVAARDLAVAMMQTGQIDSVVLSAAGLDLAALTAHGAATSAAELPAGVAAVVPGVEEVER